MDMGVIRKISCVGMQNHGHADFRTKMFWVSSKGFQDFSNTFEHNGIDGFLMPIGQVSQLIRQGKRCQKIGHRHELCLLFIKPGAGLVIETPGAVAITA